MRLNAGAPAIKVEARVRSTIKKQGARRKLRELLDLERTGDEIVIG